MRRSHILLVEDDLDQLEALTVWLESQGFAVSGYTSTGSALADTEAVEAADMLITDFHLGEENGADLLEAVRQLKPELPALVVSGARPEAINCAFAGQPEVAVFPKPLSPESLSSYLNAYRLGSIPRRSV